MGIFELYMQELRSKGNRGKKKGDCTRVWNVLQKEEGKFMIFEGCPYE